MDQLQDLLRRRFFLPALRKICADQLQTLPPRPPRNHFSEATSRPLTLVNLEENLQVWGANCCTLLTTVKLGAQDLRIPFQPHDRPAVLDPLRVEASWVGSHHGPLPKTAMFFPNSIQPKEIWHCGCVRL
jgi:hypothetical protein